MMRIISILPEAAAAAVFLLPLLLLLNRYLFHSTKRTVVYTLFALYLAVLWSLVGLPNVAYIRFDLHINLIPFAGMLTDFSTYLNVLLFIPLGCFLPVLWPRFRNGKQAVLLGFCTSAGIELLQILTLRATDINDLITNTLGTAIGWGLGRLLLKILPKAVSDAPERDIGLLYGCVFSVMFFAQPFLSGLFWNLIF